jgi:simple sugar transport system ATP-binding protein
MLRAWVEKVAEGLVDEFDIRAASVHARGGTLSGGNAQKMILARELSFGPKIVVYNKPTYGLDFKTTLDIRKRVRDLATDDGVAAVVMSPDLDELVGLCDRIGVMFRGRLTGVVDNHGSGVEQRVGELMVGGGEGAS